MALCYKDRTFCKSDCINVGCFRYYDEGVAKDAEEFGLPCSLSNFEKGCKNYLSPKQTKQENLEL